MSHPDEHESKAREWLETIERDEPGDIESLAALLRSVAEDARREEAGECRKIVRSTADEFYLHDRAPINAILLAIDRRGAKR